MIALTVRLAEQQVGKDHDVGCSHNRSADAFLVPRVLRVGQVERERTLDQAGGELTLLMTAGQFVGVDSFRHGRFDCLGCGHECHARQGDAEGVRNMTELRRMSALSSRLG